MYDVWGTTHSGMALRRTSSPPLPGPLSCAWPRLSPHHRMAHTACMPMPCVCSPPLPIHQVEHHVWPSLSALSYQRGQPELKRICQKHGACGVVCHARLVPVGRCFCHGLVLIARASPAHVCVCGVVCRRAVRAGERVGAPVEDARYHGTYSPHLNHLPPLYLFTPHPPSRALAALSALPFTQEGSSVTPLELYPHPCLLFPHAPPLV
jgi:hypothetical protein